MAGLTEVNLPPFGVSEPDPVLRLVGPVDTDGAMVTPFLLFLALAVTEESVSRVRPVWRRRPRTADSGPSQPPLGVALYSR